MLLLLVVVRFMQALCCCLLQDSLLPLVLGLLGRDVSCASDQGSGLVLTLGPGGATGSGCGEAARAASVLQPGEDHGLHQQVCCRSALLHAAGCPTPQADGLLLRMNSAAITYAAVIGELLYKTVRFEGG